MLSVWRQGRIDHHPRMECGFFQWVRRSYDGGAHGLLTVNNHVQFENPLLVWVREKNGTYLGSPFQVYLAREWFGDEYADNWKKRFHAVPMNTVDGPYRRYKGKYNPILYKLCYEIDYLIANEARRCGHDGIIYCSYSKERGGRMHFVVVL